MCKSKAVNIDNDPLVIGRSHSDTIKKISHPKNEVASLSFFHLRAIFYGANIGIHFITPKNDDNFSHIAMNFKTISTPHTTKTLTSASHCSAANRAPPEARRRSGSGRSARRAPRRNRAAQSPNRPCARSHDVVPTEKRRSKRLKPWAFFRLIGELSTDRPHRVRPPRRRKKRGRRNRRKSSRANARTTPSFCFSPSPIGSNSVVHNALRVKISKNLTYRKYHTTPSASTPCG